MSDDRDITEWVWNTVESDPEKDKEDIVAHAKEEFPQAEDSDIIDIVEEELAVREEIWDKDDE